MNGLEKALISMGYRKKESAWLKPIGYMVFVYCKEEIRSYFKAIDSKAYCWSRRAVRPGKELSDIKEFECYSRTDLNPYGDSQFQFIDTEDLLKFLL